MMGSDPNLNSPPLPVLRRQKGKTPVAYVYSAPDHVQFGFFAGSRLKDPQGLLRGEGKFVRHIRLVKPSGIDEPALRALLKQTAR
jgi:hypothetical protein